MKPRFLISRLSALGDVVCTLPVASCLKASYPEAEIVWVVDPRFAGVVECCTHVDEIVRARPGFLPKTWPRVGGVFTAALDMQGLSKSAVVVGLSRSDLKLGYHWQRELAWLFSSRVLPDPSSQHVVDQYVDVARQAGGTMDRAEFALKPKPADQESVQTKLREIGVTGQFVVVNPGAGWATKRWPVEHFAALIDALSGEGVPSVLIGGPGAADREGAEEVLRLCKERPASLVGETSVRELIALIGFAAAHVGGDTGSTHIAAALDRPAIGLYSITKPTRSCPYGQISRCHYDPAGLARIAPESVLRTVKEALA